MSPEAKLNIMKYFKFSLKLLIALIGLYTTTACSDKNDGPDIPNVNYNKLKIGRMDLSGAVSVGLKNEDNSRAINGEYLSAGMYKIDTDGNIYAVAVYFTTDTLGNRLDHEERLRIVPKNLENISKDYLLVIDCSYYDREGDKVSDKWEFNEETEECRWIKQDVPYKHLLVRKSDGKIWCVDNIKDNILDNAGSSWNPKWYSIGEFIESNRGDLYFVNHEAYKFNLSSDDASFEQIATGDGNIYHPDGTIVTDNGIIGEYKNSYNESELYFGWPHSGFTNLDKEEIMARISDDFPDSIPVGDLGAYAYYRRDTIHIYNDLIFSFKDEYKKSKHKTYLLPSNNKLYLLVSPKYYQTEKIYPNWWSSISHEYYIMNMTKDEIENAINKIAYEKLPLPTIYSVTPGENPREIAFIKLAVLNKWNDYRFFGMYKDGTMIYGGHDHYIPDEIRYICSDDNLYVFINNYLTCFDLKNNNWEVIKELESDNYDIEYQGKLWSIVGEKNDPDYGANWLDINTAETGFVKFNVTLPDFVKYDGYENGIRTYSGVDPATSNKVNIYIDITTGEAVNEVKAPEMQFTTIVPLN